MEKFMKKMWKKSEGFTLVELIVVIAILGILAAVAVPAYSGYITKANDAADTTVLASILTAAQAVNATSADGDVDTIVVVSDANGKVTTVTIDTIVYTYDDDADKWTAGTGGSADFDMYMGSAQPVFKGSFKTGLGADWDPTNGWH